MDEYVPYLKQKYPSLGRISERQLETVAAVIRAESQSQRSLAPASLCPFDFLGLDNSGDGFMAAYFNWRWFRRGSVDYRLVTVEFGKLQEVLSLGPPRIVPRDLAATAPDYHDELFNCIFNWRQFNRGGTAFKVVTIETLAGVAGLSYPIGNFVEPWHLTGLPEDRQDWDSLKFYWRWFQRNDDHFRVLTLE